MTEASPIQPVLQLYDLQNEMIIALSKRSWTKKLKEHMRGKVRLLGRLLDNVQQNYDGYLGGPEVLDTIKGIQTDVQRRIGIL